MLAEAEVLPIAWDGWDGKGGGDEGLCVGEGGAL